MCSAYKDHSASRRLKRFVCPHVDDVVQYAIVAVAIDARRHPDLVCPSIDGMGTMARMVVTRRMGQPKSVAVRGEQWCGGDVPLPYGQFRSTREGDCNRVRIYICVGGGGVADDDTVTHRARRPVQPAAGGRIRQVGLIARDRAVLDRAARDRDSAPVTDSAPVGFRFVARDHAVAQDAGRDIDAPTLHGTAPRVVAEDCASVDSPARHVHASAGVVCAGVDVIAHDRGVHQQGAGRHGRTTAVHAPVYAVVAADRAVRDNASGGDVHAAALLRGAVVLDQAAVYPRVHGVHPPAAADATVVAADR